MADPRYQGLQRPRPLPLATRARHLLLELVPNTEVILRSAALGGVFISALGIAFVAWLVFYAAVGVGQGVMKERVWLQYGHGKTPYYQLTVPSSSLPLVTSTPYTVSLSLLVPNSPVNLNMGNFMASISVVDSQGASLASASRPATLQYVPPQHFAISSYLPFPLSLFWPHVSPRSSTSQIIKVPLFENQVLSTRWNQAKAIEVEVGRRDGPWMTADSTTGKSFGEVQIYESWLFVEEHLSGIRGLLTRHPFILFLTFLPSFIFFELVSAGIIYMVFIARAEPKVPAPPPSTVSASSDSSASTFVRIKKEEDEPQETDFDKVDREEYRLGKLAEMERERRLGARMGGVIPPSDEEDEETTSAESSGSTGEGWEGVEAADDEKDDGDTIGGSETTRGTISSFGPSLASTSRSSATAESSAAGGMRARSSAGGAILEEDD